MRSTITITAVVLVHAAVLTFIGCRTTTGFPEQSSEGTTAYGVGYKPPSATTPVTTATTTTPATYTPPPITTLTPETTRSQPTGETRLVIDSSHQQPVTEVLPEGKRYKVKKNESLWLIARREGVSVKALQEANGMRDNEVLKEGRELIVPGKQGGSTVASANGTEAVTAGGDVYVVQKGDVLGTIARKHGTTVAKLKAANGLKSDMVRIGQTLRIPSDAVSPAPAGTGNTTPATPGTRTPVTAPGATTLPPPPVSGPSTGLDIGDGFGDFRVTSPTATPPVAPPTTTTTTTTTAPTTTTTTTPVDAPTTLTR